MRVYLYMGQYPRQRLGVTTATERFGSCAQMDFGEALCRMIA